MKMERCADCGYLSLRHNKLRTLDEAEPQTRKDWTLPKAFQEQMVLHENNPVCFAMAFPLVEECDRDADGRASKDSIIRTISKERTCPKFIKWMPGHTPKDHKAMEIELENRKLNQAIKEAADKREDDRDACQKAWQESRDDDQRKWQEDQTRKSNKRQSRLMIISAVFGGILTLAGSWIKEWVTPKEPQLKPDPPHVIVQPPQVIIQFDKDGIPKKTEPKK
jgi:hypothetical protein